MSMQDILNADISSVGTWIRQGLVWWIDELCQMVPERWRSSVKQATIVAVLGDEGQPVRLWRCGLRTTTRRRTRAIRIIRRSP